MEEILKKARAGKYAVAAYNTNNLEWSKFILEASEESKTPLIIEVSEPAITYMGGYKVVVDMIKALVIDLNISIPVAIHLDHGKSIESCKKAIDAGFTSVMYDGSQLSIEDNVKNTKNVVDYAHSKGVTVEAEVGKIGVASSEIAYAELLECERLVKETNLDFLAPALGNIHGLYEGKPHIDFKTTKEISELTNVPLVLHGGTGIPDDMLLKGIASGVCKVNINTELQIAWANAVRQFLNENKETYDPRKIIKAGEKAIKQAVAYKNKLLGSYGKAK